MSELKEKTVELAQQIKGEVKYDKDNRTIIDDNTYERHLPEGLSMNVIESVDGYNALYIAATAKASGEIAIEHMAKEPTLQTVTAQFQMGKKNEVSHVINREATYTNPTNPKEPIVKHGDISSKFSVYAGLNRGDLKKVRSHLQELATEKLVK